MALAAADACTELAGVTPALKWPNDLVVDDRKLAGILAEADAGTGRAGSAGAPRAVVVGMGLNVAWPRELPEELRDTAVSLNHVTEARVDRDELLGLVLAGIDARYAPLVDLPTAGRTRARRELASEYRRRCATVGRTVRVELTDETFTGTAADISDEGHLLVDVGMCLRTVTAGDVVHLRTGES